MENNKNKKALIIKNDKLVTALTSLAVSILLFVIFTAIYFKDLSKLIEVFNNRPLALIGVVVLISAILFSVYYIILKQEVGGGLKSVIIIYSLVFLQLIFCALSDLILGKFARPYAFIGLMCAILINKRVAYFVQIYFSIILMMIEGFMFEMNEALLIPSLAGILTGIVVMIFVSEKTTRFGSLISIIKMIPVCIVVNVLFYYAFIINRDIQLMDLVLQSVESPILAILLFFAILPFMEKIFRVLTPYYVSELCDINKGLLLELSKKAPGTFNHSLNVSNLASACAMEIGENAQIARACGLYHDIGKMIDPNSFTENQIGEDKNIHDKLTPELSVSLIKRHVIAGREILLKNHLPDIIISACVEHHGTMPLTYFYMKAQKLTDGVVDVEDYSYDGPKPSNKINAIMMIVDACEAASRSLTERNRDSIDKLVKGIIEDRIELGQFDDCGITFKELTKIRYCLVDNFSGVYHERVSYPKLRIKKVKEEKDQ